MKYISIDELEIEDDILIFSALEYPISLLVLLIHNKGIECIEACINGRSIYLSLIDGIEIIGNENVTEEDLNIIDKYIKLAGGKEKLLDIASNGYKALSIIKK